MAVLIPMESPRSNWPPWLPLWDEDAQPQWLVHNSGLAVANASGGMGSARGLTVLALSCMGSREPAPVSSEECRHLMDVISFQSQKALQIPCSISNL